MPELPACSHCSAPGASSRCGNCLETVYCNRDCQRAHWKAGHKALCEASVARLKARSAGLPGAAPPASALSVRELQAALRALGVPTAGLLEKAELVQALERARAAAPPPQAPAPPPPAATAQSQADAAQNLARMAEAAAQHAAQGGSSSKFAGLMGKAARDSLAAAQGQGARGGGQQAAPAAPGASAGGGGGGGGGGSGGGGRSAIYTGSGFVDAGELDTTSHLSRAELLDLCTRRGRPSPTAGDAMVYGLLSMRLLASAEGDQRAAEWTVSFVKSAEGGAPGTADLMLTMVLDEHGTTRGLKPRVNALRETIEAEMRRHGLQPRA